MVVKKSFQLNSDNADSKVRHSVKEAINKDAASVNSGELSTWGVLSRFCDCGVSIKGSGGDEAVLSPQGKLGVLLMAKRNGTPLEAEGCEWVPDVRFLYTAPFGFGFDLNVIVILIFPLRTENIYLLCYRQLQLRGTLDFKRDIWLLKC